MASKSSNEPTTKAAKKGDAGAQAGAAPQAETRDDLAEVEAVIDEAQRAAGAMAEGVDQSAFDAVEGALAEAASDASAGESGEALNEIVAAIEEVESAQQSAGTQATLEQYDEAIASAVDDMLEGDFVSVDLVLEGMHETTPPPVPVQAKPSEAAEPAEAAEPEAVSESMDEPAGPDVDVADRSEDASGEQAAAEAEGEADARGEGGTDGAELEKASPAPEAAVAATADMAEEEPLVAEPSAGESADTAGHAERPAPATATTPARPKSAQNEPVPSPSVPAALINLGASFLPAARAGVVAVLQLLSVPLRFVPPKAREVVDWIALSLVFWVPLVWIFALFIVG